MKETLASYYIRCDGILPEKDSPLITQRPEVSITVFRDGKREVGCSYIETGKCTLAKLLIGGSLSDCIHLFPESSKLVVRNFSRTVRIAYLDSDGKEKVDLGKIENPITSELPQEDWPYHFRKTRHHKELELRFPGKRVDDLVREAINQTTSIKKAAQFLGVTFDEINNWKNQFDIKLPKRHR